jgi:glycosidase
VADATLYQVNLRALAAREPRNAIEAAAERGAPQSSPLAYAAAGLPRLRRLGVDALYFMPLFRIGRERRKGIGSPYATADFSRVDPEFGTRDELRALVARAHRLGMKVILDITPNHTARDHAWTRRPGFHVRNPDGSLHHDWDWSDTAKLDYRNPALRAAMRAALDGWLSCLGRGAGGAPDGVDGFRFDMAHILNDLSFWDETLPALRARHAGRELLFLAECYGAANNLDLFRRGMNAAYDDDFYKCAQYLYGRDAEGRSAVLPDPAAAGNADFAGAWEAFRAGGIAAAFEASLLRYERELPAGPDAPRLARYTDNHDEGRGIYRFGEGAARAVNALAFLSGHSLPLLLSGQEFGAANRPSIHERIGTCDKGFRGAGGAPSRAGVEFEGNLFARGAEGRRAWYDFFRGLARLRRASAALRRGAYRPLDAGEDCPAGERAVVAFERELGEERLRCAVNLGPEPRRLRRAALFGGTRLWGSLRGGRLDAFSAVAARCR